MFYMFLKMLLKKIFQKIKINAIIKRNKKSMEEKI